ncbi:MAG TPA: cyd operon YbgE family protein [Gallionella sp.]|nr:cyd operon YbgE family protein [Gallionella sp.]
MSLKQTPDPVPHGGAYAVLPRMVSLLTAMVLAGMVLAYPRALGEAGHGMLSLMMLGICAGFVHGVGFVPEHKLLRIAFGPWLAWPLMGMGLWLLTGW